MLFVVDLKDNDITSFYWIKKQFEIISNHPYFKASTISAILWLPSWSKWRHAVEWALVHSSVRHNVENIKGQLGL